jgi:VWFA-related protein
MRLSRIVRAGLMLAAMAFSSLATKAQAPAGPIHPAPQSAPRAAPGQSQTAEKPPGEKPLVHVRTNLVTAPVTVRDSKGELALHLTQNDFHIFDNGIEQKIQNFDLGGDPLSIVLAVETSSRVEPMLPAIRKSGIVFSQAVMGPNAEAAVLGIDDSVTLLQPFTASSDTVQRAINQLPEGFTGLRLYDALARGVSMLKEQPENRKRVILAISESQDADSTSKLGEVLREAQLANITIYTIGLSSTAALLRAKQSDAQPQLIGPPGTFPLPTPNGSPQTPTTEQQVQPGAVGGGNIDLLGLAVWIVEHAAMAVRSQALEVSSAATGGLYLKTFRDRSIEKSLDDIGGELHAQYSVSYQPAGEQPFGYHEIKVTVSNPDLKIRTRPGYYLAEPEK